MALSSNHCNGNISCGKTYCVTVCFGDWSPLWGGLCTPYVVDGTHTCGQDDEPTNNYSGWDGMLPIWRWLTNNPLYTRPRRFFNSFVQKRVICVFMLENDLSYFTVDIPSRVYKFQRKVYVRTIMKYDNIVEKLALGFDMTRQNVWFISPSKTFVSVSYYYSIYLFADINYGLLLFY